MKAKTSLTLSEDVVRALDRLAGSGISRSAFIEQILRDFLDRRAQAQRHAREAANCDRDRDHRGDAPENPAPRHTLEYRSCRIQVQHPILEECPAFISCSS